MAPANLHLHHAEMARTSTARSTEVLAGLVDRVTFHNPENGFCVLRVKARGQRDLITLLGHAAMISAGEFVQASGSWVNDRTHGVQFKASFLKATAPTTVEGIEKCLGSGMIRGIGPVYAKKLVRAFGEAVFDVIEQEPPRLREVTGIGPKRARRSGAIIVLASGALYIAMKGRVAWYGLMQWALSDTLQPVGKVVLAVDRAAYILAFVLGAIGWAYISSRRISPRFHASCRAQLKRGLLLAMAAACPMVVSVIVDAVVTALRLLEERAPVSVFMVPLLSIGIEVAFAAVLVTTIGKTLRNTVRASSRLSS